MNEDKKQFTGVCDTNVQELCVGDTVKLFHQTGTVVFEEGAFGIVFLETIDWDTVNRQVEERTLNAPSFCYNDVFVSFWELLWNFNCEQEICSVVERIPNPNYHEDKSL